MTKDTQEILGAIQERVITMVRTYVSRLHMTRRTLSLIQYTQL